MKTITLLLLCLLTASPLFAADFSPTLLKLNADPMIEYVFDGSSLDFPILVSGTPAQVIFSIFTKDMAADIPYSVNGYLGWHQVNKVDTCIYFSAPSEALPGPNVISWDGKDLDGGVVPVGEYTYYLWAFDNKSEKQIMSRHLSSGWGFGMTSNVQAVDTEGLPLANPIWYRAKNRWSIGSDPLDKDLMISTTISLDEGWQLMGDPSLDPLDFNYEYLRVGNKDARKGALMKLRFVPGGDAEIVTEWGKNAPLSEIPSTFDAVSAGVATDGSYLYTNDTNYTTTNDPDSEFYIYDMDGFLVEEIDLTPWWSSASDYEAGGQMNGGPRSFDIKNGYLFLNCHCNCLVQMIDPGRYLKSGNYDDLFVWSNGNGDYTLDKNFEETARYPWVCNDYNVGPYKYNSSSDDKLFSAANAYDVGAVSFGLLAPDGTGLGYFAFAGDTAGWKKGVVFIDNDTPYDGLYCDDTKFTRNGLTPTNEGIFYIGHDSIKGRIIYELSHTMPGSITLTSPNGGETLASGSESEIS